MTFLLKNQNKDGKKTENMLQVWIHTYMSFFTHVPPHTVCRCCTADMDSYLYSEPIKNFKTQLQNQLNLSSGAVTLKLFKGNEIGLFITSTQHKLSSYEVWIILLTTFPKNIQMPVLLCDLRQMVDIMTTWLMLLIMWWKTQFFGLTYPELAHTRKRRTAATGGCWSNEGRPVSRIKLHTEYHQNYLLFCYHHCFLCWAWKCLADPPPNHLLLLLLAPCWLVHCWPA